MDISIKYIPTLASNFDVKRAIAIVLHGDAFVAAYRPHQSRPVNFQVILVPDGVPNSIRNGGEGTLTLPDVQLGHQLLQHLRSNGLKVKVLKKPIRFFPSDTIPHPRLVHTLQKVPYQDPNIVEEKEEIVRMLMPRLCIRTLQFGVFFRKPPGLVFSPEWEEDYCERGDARLAFEYEHKLLRVKTGDHSDAISHSVVLTFVNLKRIFIGWDTGDPFILFHLTTPPALESEDMYRPDHGRPWEDNKRVQRRVAFLNSDEAHRRVAPYAHQLRLVLKEGDDLQNFVTMCRTAGIQIPVWVPDNSVEVQRLKIFSSTNLRKIDTWITGLPWSVAFQCEALLRNLQLNALELLRLRPRIDSLAQQGLQRASQILRHLHTVLRSLRRDETVDAAFTRAVTEFDHLLVHSRPHSELDYFDAHHVSFTPTATRLEGPYTHQTNRVLRKYVDYQEFFIRVDFRDEDRLQYRWDREVDGASFVRERVGQVLHHGFTIAGRKFDFLGYSQSQLRSHSVFAVAPFEHPKEGLVTASTIRDRVGIFDEIICYPALYAARLSQAFSSTEDSVTLQRDQWDEMDDIVHHGRNFTDGVGTISPDLAKQIWRELCEKPGRTSTPLAPVAFQIRFGGYKGMVAVDPRLTGIMMRLRPSMRKFHVHEIEEGIPLEIARAFHYPGRMCLNRPLIQILEDLHVPKESFLDLQEAAVADVHTARDSLSNFARLIDTHALGRAYSLSYLVRSLGKIGCDFEHHDPKRAVATPFVRAIIDTAVVSVLRYLKHSARIPVPQGWLLPGVADEGGVLQPGQIFACIWEPGAKERFWLEGPVLVSRSPTIHTGDVQVVYAIGRPPKGSIYELEPLPNVVVFPCEGKRDLASCLGGGDLDGDLYLVCQSPSILPNQNHCHRPGDYPPTKRKHIGRPSTIEDVADFVVEYINSDMVGLLSTNHLILSDQSSFGTMDPGCLKLAEMCSKAVDYPKSGIPVNILDIPRFLIPFKPDWKRDEIINPRRTDYYESTRAIGYLFRAINLEESTRELSFDPKTSELKDKPQNSLPSPPIVDAISSTLGPIVETYLGSSYINEVEIVRLFLRYATELKYICLTHTLSHDPDVRLREEEIVVGTILAKCSQARWRKDRIEQMRINTNQLVNLVSAQLRGSDTACATKKIARGWAAWKYSRANSDLWGHHSFGLVALEVVFRALDELEDIPSVKS